LVGTTDRGGVALDGALGRAALLRGIPIASLQDACAAPNPAASAYEGDVLGCAIDPSAPVRFSAPAPRYDAVAALDLVRPDGSVQSAVAAREPAGKLDLRLGDKTLSLDGFGAQVALADLDQDGVLEVIGTGTEGEDALVVLSWDGAADPRPRLRFPAPGGISALAVCPPEEGGVPALIAVVDDEVWIVP
jgi:hypothetical protein